MRVFNRAVLYVLIAAVCVIGVSSASPTFAKTSTHAANAADYGDLPNEDLGVVVNRMFAQGLSHIYIPPIAGLYIATPITPPTSMRIKLFSDGLKDKKYQILCQTGENRPAIDLQGCLFGEISGLSFGASNNSEHGDPSACVVLMARMPSGASAGNHQISNCIMEGPFAKSIIYNVGSEESLYENIYMSHHGVKKELDERSACIVISNRDEFPEIISRASRENGNSTSAITIRDGIYKQYHPNTSIFYFGPWTGDVVVDPTYCGAVLKSDTEYPKAMITTFGVVHGINVSVGRFESPKNTHVLYVKGSADCGTISFIRGSYLRGARVTSDNHAFEIEGDPERTIGLNIFPACSFYYFPDPKDEFFIRSSRTIVNSYIRPGKLPAEAKYQSHLWQACDITVPTIDSLIGTHSNSQIRERAK